MTHNIAFKEEKKITESLKPVLVTDNPIMIDLISKIMIIAETKATVLITGENGTGKEVLSRLLHYYSSRRNKPMVTVNCGAIPSELVESELFGHEKGAFTGAQSRKEGCFEWAHNSTLFLDEIGEMPLSSQVKLLRAVELGSFRPVGGKEEVEVDVRLVFATNKILIDQVSSGRFREDLFYRINVIELYVPPLRHRREDIPLLISYYAEQFSKSNVMDPVIFNDDCMDILMNYDWPGNVRELRNIVERSVVLSRNGRVTVDMLPGRIQKKAEKAVYPVNGTLFDPKNETNAWDNDSRFLSNNGSENAESKLFGAEAGAGPPAPRQHERPSEFGNRVEGNEVKMQDDKSFPVLQIPIGTRLDEIEKEVIKQTLRSVHYNKSEAARILGFARKTLHNKLEKYDGNSTFI